MKKIPVKKTRKHRFRRFIYPCCLSFLAVWMWLCISLRIAPRPAAPADGDCMLYYLVNADGMKGLGHSILLLVDDQGRGIVFSFNGMQKSLPESLLGQAGAGKMSIGEMTAEETAQFLKTGDLELDGDQLKDNYDWAVYRRITPEAYRAVVEKAQPYIQAGEAFESLYRQWAQTEDETEKKALALELEQISRDETLPLYRIYTHNCDHAARSLAAEADSDMRDYLSHTWHMTPNGNLKAFSHAAPQWGVAELGENSLLEKLLTFFMVF